MIPSSVLPSQCPLVDYHIHRFVSSKPVSTQGNWFPEYLPADLYHGSSNYITFPDEISNKGILRLIINIFWGSDLLDLPLINDNDGIGHSQGFFLVMGYVNKGYS